MCSSLQITYAGQTKPYALGTSPQTIAALSDDTQAIAAYFNDTVVELSRPLQSNGTLSLIEWDSPAARQVLWHSSAHLLAEALESLYPGIRLGIGPPISHGFYYDIDFQEHSFGEKDLKQVEKKMLKLAKERKPYVRKEMTYESAKAYFSAKNDPYKLELIEGLRNQPITFYTQGDFTDLCKGPHVPHTGWIRAVKLLTIAGAYWRGDEKSKQLTRVYGVSFPDKAALHAHLKMLEEAERYDHRKIGKKLALFHFSPRVGVGLPLWLPKGTILRNVLQDFLHKKQTQQGYQAIITPHIGHQQLYETSGHYQKYGEDSFQPIQAPDGDAFLLKPMNCPHHCEVYSSLPRSYKDLPVRFSEFGTVYRYEQSGELHGLTRVRGFTQDDAHIFCTHQQVKDEFVQVIQLMINIFKALELEKYTAQLSFRDPKQQARYIGEASDWEQAEQDIQAAADQERLPVQLVRGEAAFYGPKLDFMVQDALGRSWQLGTIQLDYQLPKRFDLQYMGADNQKHCPVMIHRALFGSMERFVALLLEHYKGALPLALSPVQVGIIPVSDKFIAYARQVNQEIQAAGFRTYLDDRDERVGKKVREAEVQRLPLTLVVGEKELETDSVSVRTRNQADQVVLSVPDFVKQYQTQITL